MKPQLSCRLDHDELALNHLKLTNVIDCERAEHNVVRKPLRAFRHRVLTLLALCAGAVPALLCPAAAASLPGTSLIPHRAVYDLKLVESHKPSLQAAPGRIVYDFSGSTCEGYTTEVRQVSELVSDERPNYLSDLRSRTWEDDRGSRFDFNSTNYINEQLTTTIDGHAERHADGIVVTLKQPVQKTIRLAPETVFPTQQLRRVIAAARAGQRVLALPVYDGTDNGQKVYDTLSVIGPPIPPSKKPTDAAAEQSAVAGLTRWHVRVSYFEKGGSGEGTPVYTLAFEIYENGISRALTLDYKDFVIAGTMSSLEIKDPAKCK